MDFPFRHFFVAVFAAFGIFTAVNIETYQTDVITICDEVTTADYRTPAEHHPHLPECSIVPINIARPQQVVATPRPAAPGEDASTAQLLPEDRMMIDRDQAIEKESVAGLASVLVLTFKSGLDAAARTKAKREKEAREEAVRFQLVREQLKRAERRDREQREYAERAEREEREREERERERRERAEREESEKRDREAWEQMQRDSGE